MNVDEEVNQFKFNCGRMEIIDGKVKPLPDKGHVKIYVNPDNLLCWEWNSNDGKIEEEPVVLFSDEWEWKKIPTGKGRVYHLKSKCFEDEMFYWLQESDKSLDEELEKRIKEIVFTGKLNSAPLVKTKQIVSNQQASAAIPTNTTNTNSNPNTKFILDQISNVLNNSGKSKIIVFIFCR